MSVCLIDLNALFRRHWEASAEDAFEGVANAIFGWSENFENTLICCDYPPYIRSGLFENYKANRPDRDPNMDRCLSLVKDRILSDGFSIYEKKGYEADDIIASMVKRIKKKNQYCDVVIVTSDKDLMQLVDEHVSVVSIATKEKYDEKKVFNKFGVKPKQIPDFLALAGDVSDGIPGIRKVGPKTAATWLNQYEDIGEIIKNAADLKPEKFRDVIIQEKAKLAQFKTLTLLMDDVDFEQVKKDRILKPKSEAPVIQLDEPSESANESQPEIKESKQEMGIWNSFNKPPPRALTPIKGGRLKNMTDIDPQWRYEAMTKTFGPCGIGWKYKIERTWLENGTEDQMVAWVEVSLFVKDPSTNEWSDGIPGIGGSMFIVNESKGIRTNDESYKMATTDALSVSMKMIGVGANIYAGSWNGSKYMTHEEMDEKKSKEMNRNSRDGSSYNRGGRYRSGQGAA